MRDFIRKLGHIKMVIFITLLAIVSALTLEYVVYKIFSIPYTPSNPIVSFFVTATLAPLISWPFIKLILVIDDMEQKMYDLATYDSMTKLLTRRAFFSQSLKLHNHFKKSNKKYSVSIIDIDNFKSINDTYGHAYGDKVLINLGEIFDQTFDERYIAGRIGGEEFAVVMDTDAKSMQEKMETLHENISKANVPYKNEFIQYRVSIGIFENNKPLTNSFDEALSHADDALYHAKMTGKNKTVIYADTLASKNLSKKSMHIRTKHIATKR